MSNNRENNEVIALRKRVKELEALLLKKNKNKFKSIALLSEEERNYALNKPNGKCDFKSKVVRFDEKAHTLVEIIRGDYSQNAVINVLLKEVISNIAKHRLDEDPEYVQALFENHFSANQDDSKVSE